MALYSLRYRLWHPELPSSGLAFCTFQRCRLSEEFENDVILFSVVLLSPMPERREDGGLARA